MESATNHEPMAKLTKCLLAVVALTAALNCAAQTDSVAVETSNDGAVYLDDLANYVYLVDEEQEGNPVKFRFQIGSMFNMLRSPLGTKFVETQPKFPLLLGVELQIPVKNDWFIETGVDFRWGPYTDTYSSHGDDAGKNKSIPLKYFDKEGKYDGPDKYRTPNTAYPGKFFDPEISTDFSGFIDIPIRAGWKKKFKGKNELQFSFGPMLTVSLYDGALHSTPISVGLSPAVAYKHRALSLGLYYNNPVIYNGPKNRETNTLMFTIGVNFNGRTPNWENIGKGAMIFAEAMGGAAEVMSAYQSTKSGGSGYSNSSSSSRSGKSKTSGKSKNSSKDNSLSQRTARNADHNTYLKYESMVIKIINGDDTTNNKADVQQKMKQLREKWVKRGDGWQASPWETK